MSQPVCRLSLIRSASVPYPSAFTQCPSYWLSRNSNATISAAGISQLLDSSEPHGGATDSMASPRSVRGPPGESDSEPRPSPAYANTRPAGSPCSPPPVDETSLVPPIGRASARGRTGRMPSEGVPAQAPTKSRVAAIQERPRIAPAARRDATLGATCRTGVPPGPGARRKVNARCGRAHPVPRDHTVPPRRLPDAELAPDLSLFVAPTSRGRLHGSSAVEPPGYPPRMPCPARAAAAALVTLAAATAAGCREESAPPPRLPATSPHDEGVALGIDGSLVTRGVGPTCLPCHADVADRYRSSGMSDAMTLPSGAGSIESSLVGKTCIDAATGITVHFGARDGRYVQRIVYADAAGVERASYEFPVDLIIGSGHATRTYLAVREGRMVELPATWYRETGALALSPGSFFRNAAGARVEHRCIECHVGDATPHASGATGHFTGAISLGITCRRCHGEGPEHVRTGKRGDIVNPSDLDPDRQEE